MQTAERNDLGQFSPGNKCSPGRLARQTEREYLIAMTTGCTPEDWQEIIKQAVEDAKKGDNKAREWLASYLIGIPKNDAVTLSKIALEDEIGL